MVYLTQAALSVDADFLTRVEMAVLDCAADIASEAPATAGHAERITIITEVISRPAEWAVRFSRLICARNAALTSGTSDSVLKDNVAAVWNAAAGYF